MANFHSDHLPTNQRTELGVLAPSEELDFKEAPIAQPLTFLTKLLQGLLLLASLSWAGVVFLDAVLAFTPASSSSWGSAYDRSELAGMIVLVLSALALATLIVWTTRAYRNLDAASLAEESPAQVFISWFIPGVNLLLPATALEELYRASSAPTLNMGNFSTSDSNARRRKPLLVWFVWIAGPLMFVVRLTLLQVRPMVFPSGQLATVLDIAEWAADVSIAVACLAAVVMVGRIAAAETF